MWILLTYTNTEQGTEFLSNVSDYNVLKTVNKTFMKQFIVAGGYL